MPSLTTPKVSSLIGAAAFALLMVPALAGDGVPSVGPLSDDDFYRAATCGAPSGGTCIRPVFRWEDPVVTVHLMPIPDNFPPKIATLIPPALDSAIEQINAAGANIRLSLTQDEQAAQIKIYASNTKANQPMHGIPGIKDGDILGLGHVTMHADTSNVLRRASIALSASLLPYDLDSIVLEEVFQALGFPFDIENRYYNTRSVIAQNANITTKLKGQDTMALRRHYPN